MKNESTYIKGVTTDTKPPIIPIASYDAFGNTAGNFDDSTVILFSALQNAYNYFKQELFDNRLPPAILTLNRKVRCMGYYMPQAWLNKSKEIIPEININPGILELPAIEVMQTLLHEMCHHFQQFFGKPGAKGYHNIEFSRIMFSKGLMCSTTGMPGGKVTGRKMADYVIEGGLFSIKFAEMPDEFRLPFTSTEKTFFLPAPEDPYINTELKSRNKTKYSCPSCNTNVWGKPELNIICATCQKRFKQLF